MSAANAIYAQAGGVTSVINASAVGLIRAWRELHRPGKLFAAHDGVLGVLDEMLFDTGTFTSDDLSRLASTPGGAFGACRHVLNDADLARLLEVFCAYDIGYFFYNGGGGSAHACLDVARAAQAASYPLITAHIPKTIDNDLPHTDCCPGFGSTAKYLATAIQEASLDLASMSRSSSKVFILETMGRYAGWLTAACGLASRSPEEGPHLLLCPEIAFDEARFLSKVQATVDTFGYCSIAVAEGLTDASGQPIHAIGERDAAGDRQLGGIAPLLARLVTNRLGYKCHWAVADYLQRAARHLASATDCAQAEAVGRAAIELAEAGHRDFMPAIRRLADAPYRWDIVAVPLVQVITGDRLLPREFLDEEGFHLSAAGRRQLQPLIEGEAYPPFRDGLPDYFRPQFGWNGRHAVSRR